ncbi:MAG: glycoside hydrolase family 95 protein [Clostridia bacterium]|nr:glycoside hydrolase family 95 protein [Clostridia bacterium]
MEKKLINSYPATHWKEATPLGNGRLGASVYGCVYDERILINHEALYNWTCDTGFPDVSHCLAEVRQLMDQGKYKEAENYYTEEIKKSGFKSNKGKFFPAFDIHLIFDTQGAPNDYQRCLDMQRGFATVSYTDNGAKCKREVFASQREGVVVVHLESEREFGVKISLERHDMSDYVDNWYGDEFKSFAKDGCIYSESKTAGKLHFSGIVRVHSTNGQIVSQMADKRLNIDMSGDVALKDYLRIENATQVTLLMDISEHVADFDTMKEQIDKIKKDYKLLLKEQSYAFAELFNRVKLNLCYGKNQSNEQLLLNTYQGKLDLKLVEKMADYGRYLLISSSVGCEYPANLQGLWNGAYSPAWACTFFNNENIQMAYWQAYAGNLKEATLPLFNLYEKFFEDYRYNAKNLFGCKGILLPLFMDNSNGYKENLQPHVIYWTGSSAWISAIYYDYYLYTGDEKFLLEKAYPFMKESAEFYEDFYVYDGNGMLKSYPSDSPENRPNGDFEGAKEISVSINATMDFALLKELLTNLTSAINKLGIDKNDLGRWQKMLDAIPPYEVNEDGAIKEWMHPDFKDNYHHRHQSHIYPLFPGFEIDEYENKELFEAIKVAVEKRLCIGLKSQTGWSLAHMANIYARLGDGKRAEECLNYLIRFCTGDNLYTHHNDWRNMGVTLKFLHAGHPPFQIDANMGFTSAVYEMLMYSDGKKIKILPAIPLDWKKGSIENIQARGGYSVSIFWDEEQVRVRVVATRDGSVKIYPPKNTINSQNPIILNLSANEGKDLIFIRKK